MGKYHDTVMGALKEIRHLDAGSPDFKKSKEEVFSKVSKVIDAHIREELVEQKDVDNLISALVNYRKHLVFAKNIMEGKVTEGQLDNVDIDVLSKLNKGRLLPDNSHLYVQKQLELALKEHRYIKDNLQRILDQEKIRLK